MGIYNCNYIKRNKKECKHKPYIEIFAPTEEEDDGSWAYLCFWHYIKSRIDRMLRRKDFGWCKVDTDREAIEHLRFELWDMQGDLLEIKEKLGIKDEKTEEIEKELMKAYE